MHNLVKLSHFANGYHCALLKDYSDENHVILQMRRDKDALDCEVWQYLGQRLVTKKYAKQRKADLLQAINKQFSKNFTRLTID